MPTVEGLQFAYALYALPPGRLPFGRWRWELWHGASMVAAPDAEETPSASAARTGNSERKICLFIKIVQLQA